MTLSVDEALQTLGRYGRWQVLYFLVIGISDTFPSSWHMMAIVFMGGIPEYRCNDNDGLTKCGRSVSITSGTLPYGSAFSGSMKSTTNGSSVESYVVNRAGNSSSVSSGCTTGWTYWGNVGATIVSEWDLVCDHAYLVETSQTLMVIGVLFGAMFFTTLADNFGRKPVFLFSQLAMVTVGVITAFSASYWMFATLRIVAGALQQGIILTGFIMTCELFPADMRTMAGMGVQVFWAMGMCILALIGYLVRDWRQLQLAITLPGLLTISFIWILPESIPWLCANGRKAEAERILLNAFRMNGDTPPDTPLVDDGCDSLTQSKPKFYMSRLSLRRKLLTSSDGKGEEPISNVADASSTRRGTSDEMDDDVQAGAAESAPSVRYTVIDVVRNRRLRMYSIIMCLLWFVNSLVYYGLSLNTSAIAGDRYLNFFFSGLVEIPAYLVCCYVLQKWGRRRPIIVFHVISGVALIATTMIPEQVAGVNLQPLEILFTMIGKFGITGSFGAVFLYAPEIFPTTLRSQAMGLASLGGRLGNMLSPFSAILSRRSPWLTGLIFGILSMLVGLLVLTLPETVHRPLPQTIEDVERWHDEDLATKRGRGIVLTDVNCGVRETGEARG